jgi:hypothetical protein
MKYYLVAERVYEHGPTKEVYLTEYHLIGDPTIYTLEEAEKKAKELNTQYSFTASLCIDIDEYEKTLIEPYELIELNRTTYG